jgi:magnesium-transporting ATPase (P-type)
MASSVMGLTPEEAERRLKIYGRNLVTREKQPTLLEELWDQICWSCRFH